MKYFQTSDKKLFYVEDLAKNHAKSLEDKTVQKVDSKASKAESKEDNSTKLKVEKKATEQVDTKKAEETKTDK